MSVVDKAKTYDNPFVRRCFVGICSFFYEIIDFEIIKNNEKVKIKVPFLPSLTGSAGSEHFIQDVFLPEDKFCKELEITKHISLDDIPDKIKGNLITIPCGVISYDGSVGLMVEESINDNSRALHTRKVETEFGDEFVDLSSRVDILPIRINFNIKIKCSSENERLLIFDSIIDKKIWKVRKFFISWKEFKKIPAIIQMPDTLSMERSLEFTYNQLEKRPEINFAIEMITYRPVIDDRTTYFANNKSSDNTISFNP